MLHEKLKKVAFYIFAHDALTPSGIDALPQKIKSYKVQLPLSNGFILPL